MRVDEKGRRSFAGLLCPNGRSSEAFASDGVAEFRRGPFRRCAFELCVCRDDGSDDHHDGDGVELDESRSAMARMRVSNRVQVLLALVARMGADADLELVGYAIGTPSAFTSKVASVNRPTKVAVCPTS